MNKIAIYGGLGNQMFQYALYLAFKSRDATVKLSLSDFLYQYHHNGFNLYTAFDLQLPLSSKVTSNLLKDGELFYKNRLGSAVLRRVIPLYKKTRYTAYREKKEFQYDADLFNQQSKLLMGTWQVVDYFKDISDAVYRAFTFRAPVDAENLALAEKIRNSNAVSVHVRRGDYQGTGWEKSHHVIKDTTYYKNALAHIDSNIENPVYFVFSDNISWVKENINLPSCTYIHHNKGKNSYLDMYLMSLCKHNIIANSTFSWWGAWLNRNTEKIVIMPNRWLNNIDCPGIFPQDWIKLPVE
ncbi:MAG: alpha-1,2-fucosyltransferase [Chitinophagaceae bacterium]